MRFVELLPPAEAVHGNEKWYELRRAGVTASEIAAVMGISPWESPFSIYWQKVNDWHSPENGEMSAGRRAESVIAEWYTERADPNESDLIHVVPAGLYRSSTRPWQLATPDRLICPSCPACADLPEPESWVCIDCAGTGIARQHPYALLECKYVVQGWDGWGDDGTDEIPVHYRAQALWQADTLGVYEVHVAAWHGADLRIYRIDAATCGAMEDLETMRQAARDFLARVHAGEPPDVDAHAATLRTLRALHPDLEDRDQEIPADVAEAYRGARAALADAQRVADMAEARLRAVMGPARRAVAPDGSFVASRSLFEVDERVRAAYSVDRLNAARGAK